MLKPISADTSKIASAVDSEHTVPAALSAGSSDKMELVNESREEKQLVEAVAGESCS